MKNNMVNSITLKQVATALKKFHKDASIDGKDLEKYWIIDKEEERALRIVIDLLNDCI